MMRQLFVVAAGFMLLLSACSKDEKENLRKFVSFQVDSLIVLAEQPKAILTPANLTDADPDNDYPKLTITATGNHGETITFTLLSSTDVLLPGDYSSTTQGNGMLLAFEEVPQQLQADYDYGSLTFNLQTVQDTLIEGTFSGTMVDATGAITPKSLYKGYLRAIITKE